MPTSSRLVAALLLAALGWYGAELVKPYLTEGRQVGLFAPISAGWGVLVGWVFTGRRLGRGSGSAAGIGLASTVLLVFWTTLGFALYEMVQRSMNQTYDGPVDALQGMVELAVEDLGIAAQPDVVVVLLLGGLITGAVTQWVARHFR